MRGSQTSIVLQSENLKLGILAEEVHLLNDFWLISTAAGEKIFLICRYT
jgi:hypothetical protein